jgi:hypothetical protein
MKLDKTREAIHYEDRFSATPRPEPLLLVQFKNPVTDDVLVDAHQTVDL